MADKEWSIYVVDEVRTWIEELDDASHDRVVQGLDTLAEHGPKLGRPLVDTLRGSTLANLKELRPGSIRILFVFDPWRSAILLVAGDKRNRWQEWYADAIPLAEARYRDYVTERANEEDAS
jgi:hypothetical protein